MRAHSNTLTRVLQPHLNRFAAFSPHLHHHWHQYTRAYVCVCTFVHFNDVTKKPAQQLKPSKTIIASLRIQFHAKTVMRNRNIHIHVIIIAYLYVTLHLHSFSVCQPYL